MIQDCVPRIVPWVEIPQAGFGTTNKSPVAKDDPGSVGTRGKASPKDPEGRRGSFLGDGRSIARDPARNQPSNAKQRNNQQARKNQYRPPTSVRFGSGG